ncbi:adenylate/guanylate cyclase domain-containing protein [Aestuariispira insulae]|uniref:Adenylate cyclase n=1 Tax=Aestuariispira insulae TaxID=1461337 RepID=A0A3D9HXZ6_9PROT|nr:adenylate/guanylate cyclase domain-containing protein [Aestuariispira insulae]RED54377.1 adenylate cyclase [Aestuariispira insulae]
MIYSNLRLYSGLILFLFVICHLGNHMLGLHSVAAMDKARLIFLAPWQNLLGGFLLLASLLTHAVLALHSLYSRRTLRLSGWEWTQLAMGLSIPILLAEHVVAMGLSEPLYDTEPSYYWVLMALWVAAPGKSILQFAATLVVWTHACIGLHYWLRTKEGYAKWRRLLGLLAVAYPTLSLSGYIASGLETREATLMPGYVESILAVSKLTPDTIAALTDLAFQTRMVLIGVILLPFVARFARQVTVNLKSAPRLSLPDGRAYRIENGASILEVLRDHSVDHAAICGGRGRCTTCRIRVIKGGDNLPPPDEVEGRALTRIHALESVRLACQLRPTSNLTIAPLLPPNASARDGRRPGGLEGRETRVACMFIDLRGSTKLGENKLPYDVLFILNQFFAEMTLAIQETNGHYAQFNGDGLMALYGLEEDKDDTQVKVAIRNAVRGAKRMLERLEGLNQQLSSELPEPLKMGIGIHFGEAIVGPMGPPNNQLLTAIGDNINLTARLESLTKEYGVPFILSDKAAQAGGINVSEGDQHEVVVRGKTQPVQFHALNTAPEIGPNS